MATFIGKIKTSKKSFKVLSSGKDILAFTSLKYEASLGVCEALQSPICSQYTEQKQEDVWSN